MPLRLPAWVRHAVLARRYRRKSWAHIAERVPLIQGALDAARPGYVLLAGDSHAELVGAHDIGGATVINAGIGGMSARGCAIYLPKLRVRARASAAILSVGSNDIMARAAPLSEPTARGFEAAAAELMVWLRAHADRVLVLAVPPIEEIPHAPRTVAAVSDYSGRLETLARRHGCTFLDPYADLRDAGGNLARPGALSDGVHLADYGRLASELSAFVEVRV